MYDKVQRIVGTHLVVLAGANCQWDGRWGAVTDNVEQEAEK